MSTAHLGMKATSLPPPTSYTAPDFAVPAGACCTHSHVLPESGMALVPGHSYVPAPAPLPQYLAMLDALSLDRGVLVQISVLGTDNSAMLSALAGAPQRLRGVAVVQPDISDEELLRMHALGVRGLRFNGVLGGGVGPQEMKRLAPRIAELGWHCELLPDGLALPGLVPVLRELPCPVLVDHMACLPADIALEHPAMAALRELLREGNTWVNVSGAYRLSSDIDDPCLSERVHALIDDAPDHIVWATDWPHVACSNMPDAGVLLNLLARWVPDTVQLRRILVDNPAALYQFG